MLGIMYLYQGQLDKLLVFCDLMDKLYVWLEEVVYIGDDFIDWLVMVEVGFSVVVVDVYLLLLLWVNYVM